MKVFVVSDSVTNLEIEKVFGRRHEFVDVKIISRRFRFSRVCHDFLRVLLTPLNYTPAYKRWLDQRLISRKNVLTPLLLSMNRIFCQNDIRSINDKIYKIVSKTLKNPFPTEDIIVITIPAYAHLLCARGLNVYTIIESWDHPTKSPIGYRSSCVFVWNEALKKDWEQYQGLDQVKYIYPVKLEYAIFAGNRKDPPTPKDLVRIMYPTTFGSTSQEPMFEEELKLIHALCKVTKTLGIILFIKPKPNSVVGELDEFREYSNVEIGRYQLNNGETSYNLTTNYNEQRLKELSLCNAVINLGTTFALDAAAYGLPIIQLIVDCPNESPNLSLIKSFPHLARHYYSQRDDLYVLNDHTHLEAQLGFLRDTVTRNELSNRFSAYLRQWLSPGSTICESIEEVVSHCLPNVNTQK